MERQQIEVFLALAEELHFGRTAERLRLSQARVSQLVKTTESQVGGALFLRTSRRVALTPLGEQLLVALQPAWDGVLAAVADASSAARRATGVVTVGFLGPLAGDLLRQALGAFRTTHPDVDVHLRPSEIADPAQPLRDGEVELLLTQLPVVEPGLVAGPCVIEEQRVLAVASSHRFARRAAVSLEDLVEDRIPLPAGAAPRGWERSYQPWTTPSGAAIPRGPAVATFAELLTLIAAGDAVCTVGAHNRTYHPWPGIAYVPVDDAPPLRFGLVWRAGSETPVSRMLIAAVREHVKARGGPASVATASPG